MLVAGALAASALASSCFLTTSLDGLAGQVVPEGDGGTDGRGGDADGSGGDGSSGTDFEAGAPGDGGDFCAGALFCDRFERTTLVGDWTTQGTATGSSLTLVPTTGRAGSSGLRVSLASDQGTRAVLSKDITVSAPRFRLSFSMFNAAGSAMRAVNGPAILINDGATQDGILLVLYGDRLVLAEQEFVNDTQAAYVEHGMVSVIVDRWVDVVMELDRTSSPRKVTVSYDGKAFVDKVTLQSPFAKAPNLVFFGSGFAAAGSAVTFDLDDVRIDALP